MGTASCTGPWRGCVWASRLAAVVTATTVPAGFSKLPLGSAVTDKVGQGGGQGESCSAFPDSGSGFLASLGTTVSLSFFMLLGMERSMGSMEQS